MSIKYKRLERLPSKAGDGHRIFLSTDGEKTWLSIADNSGRNPSTTDDGPLTIIPTDDPIVIQQGYRSLRAIIKVRGFNDGGEYYVAIEGEGALRLADLMREQDYCDRKVVVEIGKKHYGLDDLGS